ncbi:MAG: chaperone modulator CbpM [Bacteroidetes bacterium]|nr:chaperone modulator CbpM [Bacteroidota bacterium]
MHTENLIALDEFCATHNIEISFISSLQQTGLIEIATIEETGFIAASQLQQLEKFLRFYYDLDINLEGIETITHLLKKINALQDEIISLRNRLRLYEPNEQ